MAMDMNKMLKQARKMQERLEEAQSELPSLEAMGSAGGGAVKATATGDMRLKSVEIDPQAVDSSDIAMLQDMVVLAVNDALESASQMANEHLENVTGGLDIPGLR